VTQGPRVAEFERAFAARVGAAEAVAVSNGTAALFLVLHALGIGRGDEVIVPSLSFIATANAVVHCGATPVFVDVDPTTYNLDPDLLAPAITRHEGGCCAPARSPADLDRTAAPRATDSRWSRTPPAPSERSTGESLSEAPGTPPASVFTRAR
jgi:hypothetical protein